MRWINLRRSARQHFSCRHYLEHRGVYVLHGHGADVGVSDEAEELGAEHRGAGGEYQLVGSERFVPDLEDYVGAEAGCEQFPQALTHVRRRNGDAELPRRLHAGPHHADRAAHGERVVLDVVRRLQRRSSEEPFVAPAMNAGNWGVFTEEAGEGGQGRREEIVVHTTCCPCT